MVGGRSLALYPLGSCAQRWSRSEKWSADEEKRKRFATEVLNAGRDLRNGRKLPSCPVGPKGGAQRWSRSEKWSANEIRYTTERSPVLNAGRDLRNGRGYEPDDLPLIYPGAQRWSRSEKWSDGYGSVSLPWKGCSTLVAI